MKRVIKKIVKLFSIRLYVELLSKNWFNPFQTLFLNFYFLPFKQAIHLPIWIFGNIKIIKLNGKIVIDSARVTSGMIRINQTTESPCNSGSDTELVLSNGTLIFKGNANIGCGCRILIYCDGKIILGNNFKMNNQNTLASCNHLEFDEMVVLGHQNQIYDTDFHFFISKQNYVKNNSKAVFIGNHTFIANRVTILKGVQLPSYTTISSNSLVNKTLDIEPGTMIGGIPAKLLIAGYYRIRNTKIEAMLYNYFQKNPNEKDFLLEKPMEIWANY